MRIVKISDLSDEEKEKWQEQVARRYNEGQENKEAEIKRANKLFDENIEKKGEYNTSKHSTYKNNANNTEDVLPTANNRNLKVWNQKESEVETKKKKESETTNSKKQDNEDFIKKTQENSARLRSIVKNMANSNKVNKVWNSNDNEQQTQSQEKNISSLIQAKQDDSKKLLPMARNSTNKNNQQEQESSINLEEKNTNVLQDALGVGQNLLKGASSGVKQTMNYATGVNKAHEGYNNVTRELARAKYLSTPIEERNEEDLDKNFIEEYISDSIARDNAVIAKNINKSSNAVSKKLAELAPSIGQMGVGTGISAINPVLGTEYFFASAGGSYLDDAKARGMDDKQASVYASIMGTAEALTEQVGLENFKKAGKGIKALVSGNAVTKEAGKELVSSGVKSALKDYGVGIADNFIQEAIIDPIQEIAASAVGGADKADWSNMGQKMLEDGINGGLVSAIVGGANLGIQSCVGVVEKIQNNQTVTQQELQTAVQDASKQLDMAQMVASGIEQQVNKYKDYLTGETLDNNTQNVLNQAQNIINQNNTQNLQQNTTQNQNILPTANQQSNKTAQNGNIEQINSFLNNKELPMQSYQYEQSDNVRINNLRQDANKYFNNSEQAHNYVAMLEQIITDKNIDIRLDGNLKTPDGKVANGSYSNGVITINPNSTRAGEFIAIHELTHAIGTDSMRNIVEQYRKNDTQFDNAVKQLLQNYNTTELTDEAMADVSAQLFGNQEFINNLAQTNPNIFQRIYSEIKYLWHQFRGYKNQSQFIEDLKYKWEQAYRNNQEFNNTTKYHVSENFSNEIDKALNNQLRTNTQVKARDYTPQILVDNGVENLPMLITQKHIKSIIYTLQEAEKLGLQTKNVNYHGLGKDLLVKAIDNLDNPKAIYKTSENNYLVVTEFKDNKGKEIIVPIQINGKGRYNDVFIDENQIKSVYGRNELDTYINKNNFEQIYKKNEELDFNEGIQYSNVANSSTNSISSSNKDVNTTKYSIQESENNSDSFSMDNKGRTLSEDIMPKEVQDVVFNDKFYESYKNESKEKILETKEELQNKIAEIDKKYGDDLPDDIWNQRFDLKQKLNAVEEGYTSPYDYEVGKAKERIINDYKYNPDKYKKQLEEVNKQNEKQKQLQKEIAESSDLKRKQYETVIKNNPMFDDDHVGIRSPADIKTFDEVVVDDGESFAWGDYSIEDAKRDLKRGKVTVYSSYPIKNGTFVSTSRIQAQEYAGGEGGRVYSETVPLYKVAWINGDEGQFTNSITKAMAIKDGTYFNNTKYSLSETTTDNQGRTLTKEQQEYFKKSQVRDENGNLKEMYHSTNADFNVFNYDHAGTTGLTYGRGFYFTDNKDASKYYGNNTKKVYLDIQKPMEIGKTKMSKDDYRKLVNVVNEATNGTLKLDYGNLEDAVSEYDFGGDDIDLTVSLKTASGLSDEKFYKILKDTLGFDGIKANNQGSETNGNFWIAFQSNQIKNVDNTNPTTNPDIRYSRNNQTWQKYLEKNFKSDGTRTSLQDITLPKAQRQVAPTAENNKLGTGRYTEQNRTEKQKQANSNIGEETQNSKGESVDWMKYERPEERKFRKHYQSIIQSDNTTAEAKAIAKELMGTDTYVPESNKNQLERADSRIATSGADSELNSLLGRASTGSNINSEDIAVGERLIQYYSKIGDKTKLRDAIQATAMAGTTAGQTVQAMSLLNHQTPEGQAIWLQRSIDKMNNDLKKNRGENAEQFELTPEMSEKIISSQNSEELTQNLNEVYKELGEQVTKTTAQKIDAWRYFSMLANPRTHIRNIVGNTAMSAMQYGVKNKVAGTIESVVSNFNSNMERTHTIMTASKEVKAFAKADITNVADRLGLNENKYNPKSRLENSMRTFKSDALENTLGKAFSLNDNLLEAEDGWGLKAGYSKALAEYMTANKLSPETITDKQLAKARNYAIEQAKQATFHQDSSLASLLNQLSNKNKFAKFTMDATLPFKKTPINVAKSGLEYSPVGLVKSIVYDSVQLRKGNISVNKYIDNISKGLTGTGIALVGFALADCGILKASGSDDKDKEKFDEDRGSQTYSIKIGEKTYSLDWLAPTGIPLFVGAECFEIMKNSKEEKNSSSTDENSKYNQAITSAVNILDSFTNAMNPMTEMSMLSGLTSALKSYEQGSSQVLASMGTNAVKSYVNQFVPTLSGQIAKTADAYERSTTSTKTGVLPKAIDTTKNQIMNKIPGLRQMLPVKTDLWGNELKQDENVVKRAFNNFVAPWSEKEISSSSVDNELYMLYDSVGESSVFPDNINKNLTIDKQKYVMTSEEYAKYKKEYGKNSYKLLNSLVTSNDYKKLTDTQKQTAVENAYKYAKEQINVDYAKNNNLTYEESKLSKTINEMKKKGGNISNYLEYLSLTEGAKDNEKLQVLSDSNFSSKTKQIIYEDNILKDTDKKYSIVKSTGIDTNKYLQYKVAESNGEFDSDKKDDGTVKGKSVSGSAKEKRYNYIKSMTGVTGTQKAILFGLEYSPSNSDKELIVNYITSLEGKTKQEKLDMLSTFSWITMYKDGSFDIK